MVARDQAAKLRELVRGVHGGAARPRVIAVTSGKGGTGKSTLSVNLAICLSRLSKRVLLIDADFGLANVDLMLGVSSEKHLGRVLTGELAAKEAIQTGIEGVSFLSGGSGVEELLSLDGDALSGMIARLLQLENDADIILLDTGAGINSAVVRIAQAAGEMVVVTTPEPTAVMDAYALIKVLSQREQRPAIRLVVNRVETKREALETPDAIISLARRNLRVAVDLLGTVAYDRLISQTIKRQQPITVAYPGAQASRDIENIARKLLGVPSQKRIEGLPSFFQRLLASRAAGG